MEPTILKGDRVLARLSKAYRNRIERFDIIIYVTSDRPQETHIKRVVGFPGEHVILDAQGATINHVKIDLPASVSREGLKLKPCDVVLPADYYFVLGDNTQNSADSRSIGPIPRKNIIGHFILRF